MDRFIQAFRPAVEDDDLVLCPAHGVAFQKDRAHLVAYDATYFDKCAGYDGQQIANKINAGRRDLVDRYCGTRPSAMSASARASSSAPGRTPSARM
jgi:hypothetical protein